MTHDETADRNEPADPVVGSPPQDGALAARRVHSLHPLGPLISLVRLDGAVAGRLYAAGVLAAVVAIFTVAARLHPQGLTHGTHRQLGLPPCGFVVMAGLPCPTCGMTTSFAHTIRGDLWQAVYSQAAGFVLAVGTLAAGGVAFFAMLTGRRPALNWYRINPMHVVWGACILFVGAWGVKILIFLVEGGSNPRMRY